MQKTTISVLALMLGAGQAMGQVTVDGQIDMAEESLYTLNWLQNQPTSFGDNQPQMSMDDEVDDAALASTGIEWKIPLASLADDMGNISSSIQFIAFVNGQGHDFIANQITGGLGNGVANPGEPRITSFADSSPTNPDGLDGTQTMSVPGALVGSAMAPVLDGAEDASYGAALFVQNTGTGFGNSDDPSSLTANGSEINEAFAVIVDENDDGMVDIGDSLYILLTGNLETNFNKLDMFIDSIDGEGQSRLRGDNLDVDFNGLNRMGDDGGDDGMLDGVDLGLEFEAGFAADVYLGYTNGDTGGQIQAFLNGATLLTAGGDGAGGFLGGSDADELNVTSTAAMGEFAEGIMVVTDNSNVSGVGGSGFVAPAPDPDFANGSEINALYTYIDQSEGVSSDTLNIFISGNLETNFNRFYLFLDGDPMDGQNAMRNDNLDINFGRLNLMGPQDILDMDDMVIGQTQGMIWDTEFAPDYVLIFSTGNNPPALFVDAAVLRADGPLSAGEFILDYGSYDGGDKSQPGNNPVLFDGDVVNDDFAMGPVQTPPGGGETPRSNYAPRESQINFPTEPLPGLLQLALDNNNIGGVTATDDAMPSVDDAINVMTGIEVSIDLQEAFGAAGIGIDPANVKIGGFIINGDGNFVSNQVLGGLPDPAELGQVDEIDFGMISGSQFVTATDAPVSNPMFLCADANQDGSVTPTDFGAWLSNFNMGNGQADANNDNSVTPTDFGAWLGAFNQGAAGPMCDFDLAN